MRRILTLGVLVLATGGMLGFTASAASADGNGAQTTTQHFKNATDTFVDVVPCRDFQATITITYNGVLHYTVNKAGDFWATGTMTGTATAVPLDPGNLFFFNDTATTDIYTLSLHDALPTPMPCEGAVARPAS